MRQLLALDWLLRVWSGIGLLRLWILLLLLNFRLFIRSLWAFLNLIARDSLFNEVACPISSIRCRIRLLPLHRLHLLERVFIRSLCWVLTSSFPLVPFDLTLLSLTLLLWSLLFSGFDYFRPLISFVVIFRSWILDLFLLCRWLLRFRLLLYWLPFLLLCLLLLWLLFWLLNWYVIALLTLAITGILPLRVTRMSRRFLLLGEFYCQAIHWADDAKCQFSHVQCSFSYILYFD